MAIKIVGMANKKQERWAIYTTQFGGAIEEVRRYDLAQYEMLSLEELLSAVSSTNNKIKEYFEYHSEYLANTAM